MASNKVRFDCHHRGDGDALVVVPRIDGAALTELVDGFEVAAGMKPAGNVYGGLIPQSFRFGPMRDHFLGRSTDAMGPKTPVLGCRCGDWGCWPLMARITVSASLVTWDAFEQPHRKTRDYAAFGPFRFDRHRYDGALRALGAVIGSDAGGHELKDRAGASVQVDRRTGHVGGAVGQEVGG
jgi:hypothetical protein